ncbi:unnamed protein product, partial [Owenia fusiformis]
SGYNPVAISSFNHVALRRYNGVAKRRYNPVAIIRYNPVAVSRYNPLAVSRSNPISFPGVVVGKSFNIADANVTHAFYCFRLNYGEERCPVKETLSSICGVLEGQQK